MQVGQQVIASHYEESFRATIIEKRCVTVRTDACEFYVRKEDGSMAILYATTHGQPSTYTRGSDKLVAA
jgi:hypothetical protein